MPIWTCPNCKEFSACEIHCNSCGCVFCGICTPHKTDAEIDANAYNKCPKCSGFNTVIAVTHPSNAEDVVYDRR